MDHAPTDTDAPAPPAGRPASSYQDVAAEAARIREGLQRSISTPVTPSDSASTLPPKSDDPEKALYASYAAAAPVAGSEAEAEAAPIHADAVEHHPAPETLAASAAETVHVPAAEPEPEPVVAPAPEPTPEPVAVAAPAPVMAAPARRPAPIVTELDDDRAEPRRARGPNAGAVVLAAIAAAAGLWLTTQDGDWSQVTNTIKSAAHAAGLPWPK